MQRVVSDPSYHLYSSCPLRPPCLKVAFLGGGTYLAVPPGAHAGGAMPLLLRLTVPVGVPVRMVAGHAVMVVPEDGQTRQVHHLGPDTRKMGRCHTQMDQIGIPWEEMGESTQTSHT